MTLLLLLLLLLLQQLLLLWPLPGSASLTRAHLAARKASAKI